MSNPLSQTDWYIDPVSGKDNWAGNTAATALKTFAKLSSIWGRGNLLSPPNANSTSVAPVTVHILGSLPDSDPLNFDVILDGNVDLIFVGNAVLSSPLIVTDVVSRDRNNNIPWQLITGGGVSIGARIYNSTKKTHSWSFKEQPSGSNTFRISEPIILPAIGNYTLNAASRKSPATSDSFEIQSLFEVKTGSMRVGSVRSTAPPPPPSPRNKLVFRDLNIRGDISPEIDMGMQFYCIGCRITGSIQLATGFDRNFVNCCQLPGQTIRPISGLTRFLGGAYISAEVSFPPGSQGFLPTNCTTQLDFDVIFQHHSISIVAGNTLVIGTAGIFDSVPGGNGSTNSVGNGIMVSGGSVTCRRLGDDYPQLWGSGQKGGGLSVSSGGRFYYVTTPPVNISIPPHAATTAQTYIAKVPTITGSDPGKDDFILGGSKATYGVEYDGDFIGPTINSWVNFSNPLSGGTGFGGNAANPKSDAWILQTE